MAFSSAGIRQAVRNETYRPDMNYGQNTEAAPYRFYGNDITECCTEAVFVLTNEAAAYREFKVGSDEILYEAAILRSPRYMILQESVMDTIKSKVLAFLQKAHQVALGIIEKLKGYVFQLTGKTTKWVEVMRPRIEAGMHNPAIGSLTHDMYDWDTNYVTQDLPAGIVSLHKTWESKVGMYLRDTKELQALKKAQTDVARSAATTTNVPAEQGGTAGAQNAAAEAGGAMGQLHHDTENIKSHLQTTVASIPAEAGKAFKVSVNGSSIDTVWNNIILKAHNGNQDRTEVSLANRTGPMLEMVAGSTAMLNGIIKAYQDHANALKNYRESLSREGTGLGDVQAPSEARAAADEYVKAKFDFAITVTQEFEGIMSKGNALTNQLIKGMLADYMAALSKVAALGNR